MNKTIMPPIPPWPLNIIFKLLCLIYGSENEHDHEHRQGPWTT